MMQRGFRLLALLLVLGHWVAACGRTREGGEGSETHWLSPCSSSSDCALGECLCGVCTRSCSTVRDCPHPLEVCLAGDAAGTECAQSICSVEQTGAALPPALDPMLERSEVCEAARPLSFARAEAARFVGSVGERARVVTDGADGFLLFGDTLPGFVRLSSAGEFVRLLPPPAFEQAAMIDHVVAMPDGSLLLAGTAGESQLEHAWLGKLDASWNPEWEYELELESVERADLVALPDGGAVLAGVRWLDRDDELVGGADDILLARFSASGQLLWEKRLSFESTHSFSEQYGFRILATSAQGVQLVVPTDAGVFRVISDLDGNIDPDSLVTALPDPVSPFADSGRPALIGLEPLPDGNYAVFSTQRLTVLDAAGELVLRFDADEQDAISAVRFDEQRGELVIVGQYSEPSVSALAGPWARALRLDGEVSWQMRRPGLDFDSQGELHAGPESAPPLMDAAVDGEGNMIMTGYVGRGLEWVWVGGQSCGG